MTTTPTTTPAAGAAGRATGRPGRPGRPGGGRSRLRRGLLLLGLMPLLLAVALSVKVGVMLSHDLDGRAALRNGSLEQARSEFAANGRWNWFESWVAPYDEGIAVYRLGDAGGAVLAFSASLEKVPPAQECRVRINLALAQEALGDRASAAEDRGAARVAWREGIRVVTLGGCTAEDPDDGLPPAVRTAREIDMRLQQKLTEDEQAQQDEAEQQEQQQQQEEQEDPGRKDEQEQRSELEQRNRNGQEQRQRQERRQEQRLDDQQQQRRSDGPPSFNW